MLDGQKEGGPEGWVFFDTIDQIRGLQCHRSFLEFAIIATAQLIAVRLGWGYQRHMKPYSQIVYACQTHKVRVHHILLKQKTCIEEIKIISKKTLRYHFETYIFTQFEFIAKSSSGIVAFFTEFLDFTKLLEPSLFLCRYFRDIRIFSKY